MLRLRAVAVMCEHRVEMITRDAIKLRSDEQPHGNDNMRLDQARIKHQHSHPKRFVHQVETTTAVIWRAYRKIGHIIEFEGKLATMTAATVCLQRCIVGVLTKEVYIGEDFCVTHGCNYSLAQERKAEDGSG